jgi:hypothetical protein
MTDMLWASLAVVCFLVLVVCLGKKTDDVPALGGIVASVAGIAISAVGYLIMG